MRRNRAPVLFTCQRRGGPEGSRQRAECAFSAPIFLFFGDALCLLVAIVAESRDLAPGDLSILHSSLIRLAREARLDRVVPTSIRTGGNQRCTC